MTTPENYSAPESSAARMLTRTAPASAPQIQHGRDQAGHDYIVFTPTAFQNLEYSPGIGNVISTTRFMWGIIELSAGLCIGLCESTPRGTILAIDACQQIRRGFIGSIPAIGPIYLEYMDTEAHYENHSHRT